MEKYRKISEEGIIAITTVGIFIAEEFKWKTGVEFKA